MKFLSVIFLSVFCSINVWSQCDDFLVLDLPFSGNAYDFSGNGNGGNVIGAHLTEDRNGVQNSAYYFDGIDDEISISDDATLDLSEEWTISVWVKPDSGYGSFQTNHLSIVDKWGEGGIANAAYTLGISEGGFMEGLTYNGTQGTYNHTVEIIPIDEWTQLMVTRNNEGVLSYYINNVLVKEIANSIIPQNSTFPLKIGTAASPVVASAYPNSFRFKGVIDDVKIYTCALIVEDTNSIGISENIQNSAFIIEKNPVIDILKIVTNKDQIFSVLIYDNIGKMVCSKDNLRNSIDVSYLNSGMYFVNIVNDKGEIVAIKKIIKQ